MASLLLIDNDPVSSNVGGSEADLRIGEKLPGGALADVCVDNELGLNDIAILNKVVKY